MSYYSHKSVFHINSRNRVTGTDSNFTYKLPINHNMDYDKVVLLDCSIPKSYYIVQDGLNSFILKEGINEYTITIEAGNYNRNSLKTTVQTALNTVSSWDYTITNANINTTVDDGKYTFTVANNSSQPSFIFTNGLYEQLGFNSDSINDFVDDTLKSTNIVNLNPEGTLFIRSDICSNEQDNILQNIISVQNSTFSYIVFTNSGIIEYSKNFSQSKYNVYRFKLTDENGNEINLNGLNLVFTLMIYKMNRVDNLIQGYIKYKSLDYLSKLD